METSSLHTLLEKWVESQPEISSNNAYIKIVLSDKGCDIKSYPTRTILSAIKNHQQKNKIDQSIISRISDQIFYAHNKRPGAKQILTILDFKEFFPTQQTFSRASNVGIKSLTIMKQVLQENGIDWPSR